MSKRAAYSLIELLLLMSIASMVMGMCAVLLHSLLRLDSAGRDQMQYHDATTRLTSQFRDDTHAATRLEMPSEKLNGVKLWLRSGRVVAYRVQPGNITRNELEGDKMVRHSDYPLPENVIVSFLQSKVENASLVSLLMLSDKTRPVKWGFKPVRIEAILSHDQRFLKENHEK